MTCARCADLERRLTDTAKERDEALQALESRAPPATAGDLAGPMEALAQEWDRMRERWGRVALEKEAAGQSGSSADTSAAVLYECARDLRHALRSLAPAPETDLAEALAGAVDDLDRAAKWLRLSGATDSAATTALAADHWRRSLAPARASPTAPGVSPMTDYNPCACHRAVPGMWTSGYDATTRSFVRHGAEKCEEMVPRAPVSSARPETEGFTARRFAEIVRKRHADHEDRCLWCGKPWPCVDFADADAFLAAPRPPDAVGEALREAADQIDNDTESLMPVMMRPGEARAARKAITDRLRSLAAALDAERAGKGGGK